AWVAKLSPAGALVWATYLGGTGNETPRGLALDPAGNPVLAGYTTSADFPTTAGAYHPAPYAGKGTNEGTDGFVTKLDANGALLASTYVGGSKLDSISAMAVDGAGGVYVYGATRSS